MAKDIFHNNVKIALEKDGWQIAHDQLYLNFIPHWGNFLTILLNTCPYNVETVLNRPN